MKTVALLVLGLWAGDAVAQGFEAITLEVGETVAREVGFARGHQCDDPSRVFAEVRALRADTNLFVVTGAAVGTTLCRAGTDPFGPHVLFEITVVEPAARARMRVCRGASADILAPCPPGGSVISRMIPRACSSMCPRIHAGSRCWTRA